MLRIVAALYVLPNGPYSGLPGVDLWDEVRDACLYQGPHPVVAHPPCERWGRYWWGGPSAQIRRVKGDDGGCFESALWAVRRYGGVLEHPAGSSAYKYYGLSTPPRAGGWIEADDYGGYTCCVDQGYYGHPAQKATWLYAVGVTLPNLRWGKRDLYRAKSITRREIRTGVCQRLSKRQRKETPLAFRDVLISIARSSIL